MGNKLSCSCAPLMRKGYRYEDSPWQTAKRRDGHLLRLWAEVFHVSASGAGTVKWQQVSEDLVPVNITCIQDSPECVFHITAYNSQVDKILDVRLVQPGTRIGQASECFVYWKDPVTNDTWGLNFTSPIDAKQFRECCSPSFKFSRKASSSYSLKLDPPGRHHGQSQSGSKGKSSSARRKPVSTPASPSRSRQEPQCTCMTAEQYHRLRAQQDPRYRSATLPRAQSRTGDVDASTQATSTAYETSTSSSLKRSGGSGVDNYVTMRHSRSEGLRQTAAATQTPPTKQTETTQTSDASVEVSMRNGDLITPTSGRISSRGRKSMMGMISKSVDYSEMDRVRDGQQQDRRSMNSMIQNSSKSKSTDNVAGMVSTATQHTSTDLLDSQTLKRMLKPMMTSSACDSPVITSPESGPMTFRKQQRMRSADGFLSEPETITPNRVNRQTQYQRNLYLDLDRDGSPSSDQALFDNQCYATTPTSSNNNSDHDDHHGSQGPNRPSSSSPTSRLLLEYEMHLRNTLAKGMDAESFSLHTFEALLTQSMENLAAQHPPQPSQTSGRSSTLPHFPHHFNAQSRSESTATHNGYISSLGSSMSQDREGYYSDRQELSREREFFLRSGGSHSSHSHHSHKRDRDRDRDRGYLSDHNSRSSLYDRQDSLRSGYLSDRESRYGSIVHQASLESADSRLCYLTSSEISDDDRMSLTTAVSDEEDESTHNSPYKTNPNKENNDSNASFNCTGAVRKAGFLSVKKWLLRKKHQVELARKRGWKGYWVCLKGTTLLFYPCESREGRSAEAAPKHLIIVDGAILQPIPEHPKRDYIFCLSTAFGDAYLFQAPCQVELENWVNSIHSACAAAFARHRGKTGTLHLLQEEIYRLEKAIESDGKLKHMADLQLSVVSDPDTKQQIGGQITQWEENLERLHCEQFRLRCYMASLQNGELPNPKSLLTHVSRGTKTTLNRLGVFTVSSFHAFVCARSPSLLNNLLAGRGATKRRAPMLSRSNSASSRRSLSGSREENDKCVRVSLPDTQQTTVVSLHDSMTVEEFLAYACIKKGLNAMEHFVRVKKRRDMEDTNYFVPHRGDMIETYLHTHEVVEVCMKLLYQVELQRCSLEHMWGFSVEAELIENAERQDELCCYVSRVEDKSVAMHNGIIKSDEIMVINGAIVSDLDMMYIESVLQEELSLCMMMRSSRTEPPEIGGGSGGLLSATDDLIDSLVCPPPPTDALITEEVLSGLIVPAPSWNKERRIPDMDTSPVPSGSGTAKTSRASSFEIDNLLKTSGQVTVYCRGSSDGSRPPTAPTSGAHSPTGSVASTYSTGGLQSRSLSDAEKMRKVFLELVDTERTYVKHLTSLLENYLEPLKKQSFLSQAEVNALFGNIQEIVVFQRLFLQSLQDAIDMEPLFFQLDHPMLFKNIIFAITNAFLFYVEHFKLYSSFCASHSKVQKVLHPSEGNKALQEFLQSRNPRQQHSSTLESYLIKPIQRILKYPLLLQQLKNLTDPNSEEHTQLQETLQGMEKVAEHINEMQRIHEEYGAIFDHLFRQHQKACKQPIDLTPGDLLYYGGVEWLNIADFLGKIKKGLELHAMCFVFKTAVVFLCKERLRQKKKIMGAASKSSAASEVEIIRYQVLVPVTEVQVRTSSSRDADGHYLWELIHLKSQLHRRAEKVYVLSNSTGEFRNNFLRTIRQIIRDSVRNMSLPSLRAGPKSQGGSGPGSGSSGSKSGTADGKENGDKNSSGANPPTILQGSQTLGRGSKQGRNHQRFPSGNTGYDGSDVDGETEKFRTRSKTVSDRMDEMGTPILSGNRTAASGRPVVELDAGAKSEGEDETSAASATSTGRRPLLGRTPNHLSLSTTSTLSSGSTRSSQARLIQASNQPEKYHPQPLDDPGSPVWKPRDIPSSSDPTTSSSSSVVSTYATLPKNKKDKSGGAENKKQKR